jgi:hypothetical protein
VKFSIKEAFKAAFKVYRQNFFVVFSLSVVSAIPSALFMLYTVPKLKQSLMTWVLYRIAIPIPSAMIWEFVGLDIAGLLLAFFMTSVLFGAFRESGIKFRNYFPNFKKILNYFLVIMLLPILMVLVVCPILICGVAFYFMFNQTSVLVVNILAGLLGFAAIALFIVISLRYGIFCTQEILSGSSILQSFINSAKLTSGNFWKLFLLLLLLGLIGVLWEFLMGCIAWIFSAVSGGNGLALPFKILKYIGYASLLAPLLNLVLMHVYAQLSSPKPNFKDTLPKIGGDI